MACMATYLDIVRQSVINLISHVLEGGRQTHKNVPAENNNNMPVHHCSPPLPSVATFPPLPPRNSSTIQYVTNAPTGAAALNTIKCPLAARFDSPCLSKTDVNPKAAGALCTMIATKMMKPRRISSVVALAPIAMPSAAAWMTSPTVVASVRACFGEGLRKEDRKPSVSEDPSRPSRTDSEMEEVSRLSREMCRVCGVEEEDEEKACWGRRSMRNMRAKPRVRERPIWNVGRAFSWWSLSSSCFSVVGLVDFWKLDFVSSFGSSSLFLRRFLRICSAVTTLCVLIWGISSPLPFLASRWFPEMCQLTVCDGDLPPTPMRLRLAAAALCECAGWTVLVVATASMPSGIMTIRDVPTRIPTPILDINRSWDCDRLRDRGSAPAKKELFRCSMSVCAQRQRQLRMDVRQGHDHLYENMLASSHASEEIGQRIVTYTEGQEDEQVAHVGGCEA